MIREREEPAVHLRQALFFCIGRTGVDRRCGADITTEVAQEDLQELVTIGGVQLGSRLDTGKWAYTADEVGERLWDTTKNSLLTFALTNAPAAGHNIHVHMRAKIASDGYAKLYAGIMPSDAELRAMGISESEALGALAVFEMEKTEESSDATIDTGANLDVATASPTFANSKDQLYQNSKNIKRINGYEDVVVHGDMYGFVFKNADGEESTVSVREFAHILKESGLYNGGDIRLISCETGKTGSLAAQGLADELGVNVLAPTDVVYIYADGKMIVSSDGYTNDGEWVIFEPRKNANGGGE